MQKQVALFILYLSFIQLHYGQPIQSASGYDVLRIENEITLAVPITLEDSVWQYMNFKYLGKDLFLHSIDPSFKCKTEEDLFVDQYFDNTSLQLMKSKNSVRHRTRIVLTDTQNKKNGRELIQIKIDDVGNNQLNRGEYKYPVKHYKKIKKPFDDHPFLKLAKRKKRNDLISRLKEFNIDATGLFPTLQLEQKRRRIYVFKDTTAYATLTLDHVLAIFKGRKASFVQLELELNEIGYTESDSLTRIEMEKTTQLMKEDMLHRFPDIHQDQTPKYYKSAMLLGLNEKGSTSTQNRKDNQLLQPILIVGLLMALFVFGIMIIRKQVRERKK